jgi:hypothetical protein
VFCLIMGYEGRNGGEMYDRKRLGIQLCVYSLSLCVLRDITTEDNHAALVLSIAPKQVPVSLRWN